MNADFKLNGTVLETERLLLRPFKKEDLEDFYEYAKREGVGEMAGWPHHRSMEESAEVLKMFIEEDVVFALVYRENGKVIGSVGIEEYGEDEFSELKEYHGRKIGYVLNKNYWGKGLMPEAVNKITGYLFSEGKVDFLLCGYFSFNSQSKRVQEKCGFIPYKEYVFTTRTGSMEKGMMNILYNPDTGMGKI